MGTWHLKYKDRWTHGNWGHASYSDPNGTVTREEVEDFWGVDECEEYEITYEE